MGVKVRHVGKTYGHARALTDVSLEIADGETVVIRGPNGSGKSTLLGIVATLVQPTTGTVEYGDLGDALSVRSHLGWLGHETLCYPDLTARENVELSARLSGSEGAWEDAVERFGLKEIGDRMVRHLSRGQRQRVALARAFAHRPKLVLLDEPSTGLDTASLERLIAALRQEIDRGATMVVVTHDDVLADGLKGKVYQMDRGRLRS